MSPCREDLLPRTLGTRKQISGTSGCRLGLEKNQLGLRTPPCATGKAELTAELTREEVTFRVFMILQPMTYSILRD